MPIWFWAASGILAALLTVLSIIALFDEDGPPPFFTLPLAIGLIYLTAWIWSHT